MDPGLDLYDEALVLYGADRVLRGDVPYRDFWTMYTPGSFWVVAALFQLVGETAFVGRVLDAIVKSAIVAAVYAILVSFGRRGVALAGATLALGLLIHMRNYGVPLFGAIAAGLAGLWMVRRSADGAPPLVAASAGAAIALAMLFRHDLGSYALIASLCFFGAVARLPVADPARERLRRALPHFLAGLAVVIVPVLAWLLVQVPLADLAYNLVEVPLAVYPSVRALPFPSPGDALRAALALRSPAPLGALIVYVPPIAVGACIVVEAMAMRRRRVPIADASSAFHLVLLVLAVGYVAKGWVRVSPLHMGAGLLTTILLVGALASRAGTPRVRRAMAAIGLLAIVGLLAKPLVTAMMRSPSEPVAASVLGPRWGPVAAELCADRGLPRLRCLALDPDRAAVARFLLANGGSGQRIYVGAGRHDKLSASDIALYFVAEAHAATRWHDLHPGVQTTREVQRQMIEELSAQPVAFVVIDRRWDDEAEPNASAVSSGVTLLDDFLRDAFEPVFRSGAVSVLAPRSR